MIDELIRLIREGFSKIEDKRESNSSYSLCNMLSLAFAMFSLKDSSLSAFRNSYDIRAENLFRVYGVDALPGDTALRASIDEIAPSELQTLFKPQLEVLYEKGVFQERHVLGGYTAISFDGTGHYCSNKQSCANCLERHHRNGTISYYHQLLAAVAVHPEQKTVFTVACEAIIKQDGQCKNDCELNAVKRILPQVRQNMGKEEPIIAVFDALYANGIHIKALQSKQVDMRFIIGTKGATYVDVQVQHLRNNATFLDQKLHTHTWQTKDKICTAHFVNGLILNGSHLDTKVNYFECKEVDKKTGKTTFFSTWITDIPIDEHNIRELVAVARSRWKIENETFNTLKNQGYHLEHSYGHGKKYLATNFALLTFLAFLVDQIAQHLDQTFQAAKAICKTFKMFWERIRSIFYLLPTMSMNAIYKFIIKQKQLDIPLLI